MPDDESLAPGSSTVAVVRRHVDAGMIPGAIVVVGKDDVETTAMGVMAIGGPPMRSDAIVRIQSMTKLVSAVATLRLVQDGLLDLADPVERWLPELRDRTVLREPGADLDDVVPADRPITVRDLLVNGSGYGAIVGESPLASAMAELGVDPGPEPPSVPADEWLATLATLPLAHQPGEGFRYHLSYPILQIALQRAAATDLDELLRATVLHPLGMPDTGLTVPPSQLHRLPAAYRLEHGAPVETEPAGGGFHAGDPPFDVAHGELVSTAADYTRLLRMLIDDGRHDGAVFLEPGWVREVTSDQVVPGAKTDDSFFPGFWTDTGWGYGVCVMTGGEHRGRYGWSGGQGTDFLVDPDGSFRILLTQVELGEAMFGVLEEFQQADEDAS